MDENADRPAQAGSLVLIKETDLIDPDFIDNLVEDGFNFNQNYDTSDTDLA